MILGVSHLVLSSPDPDAELTALAAHGYTLTHARNDVPNRAEKKPYLFGAMPETTTMRLAKSSYGYPMIEVVRENGGNSEIPEFVPGSPAFELNLSIESGASITVKCRDPEQASALWKIVSDVEVNEEADSHVVSFDANAFCAGLELRYVAADSRPAPTYLNHQGLVCTAFLCRDADKMQAHLAANGYPVGNCFDLTPAETPLRLFLMRNHPGEIYEFLSLGRAH